MKQAHIVEPALEFCNNYAKIQESGSKSSPRMRVVRFGRLQRVDVEIIIDRAERLQ